MVKQFVEFVVKSLVNDKDAVKVTEREGENNQVLVDIHVAAQDLGKVIGKGGQTIRAMRSIVAIIGSSHGREIILEASE